MDTFHHSIYLLDPTPEMQIENGEEENQEQIGPPPTPNLSNAKEVSTELIHLLQSLLKPIMKPKFHFVAISWC